MYARAGKAAWPGRNLLVTGLSPQWALSMQGRSEIGTRPAWSAHTKHMGDYCRGLTAHSTPRRLMATRAPCLGADATRLTDVAGFGRCIPCVNSDCSFKQLIKYCSAAYPSGAHCSNRCIRQTLIPMSAVSARVSPRPWRSSQPRAGPMEPARGSLSEPRPQR